ncbi:hypothetical protein IQ273_02250 [Nodosilinea sp. LEGE 07298]|uniref:hypothetical protein n=1 Tax=Nodosilinea sp. LEGE 07298 TaxID=2777970 RepID=UPI0018822ABC|nr:hypothetical protein [Nodosilinea sp. LEGE 07298]MBE9108243.1 hypothetical protein [Nodosilinea sp. LEGE 07298]
MTQIIRLISGTINATETIITRLLKEVLSRTHKPLAIAGGALVGYLWGPELAPLIERYTEQLLLSSIQLVWWERGLRWICLFVGGASGGMAVVYHKELYNLRREHFKRLGKYYEITRPTGNWLTDLVWSYTAGVVIMCGSFAIGFTVWPILPFLLSTNWLVVGALFILFTAFVGPAGMGSKKLLMEMFRPHRLKREVAEAAQMIPMLEEKLARNRAEQANRQNTSHKEIENNDW